MIRDLTSEQDTKNIAQKLADLLLSNKVKNNFIIYLTGNLGAGKTTFSRYFIQACGHEDKVKSPTYTIIENYDLTNKYSNQKLNIYHLDLYRLADPQELEYLGLEDFINKENTIVLIEWPEKAGDLLPEADIRIVLDYSDNHRTIELNSLMDEMKFDNNL